MIRYRLNILGITLAAATLFFSVRAVFWLYGMVTNEFFYGMSEEDIFAYALEDGGYFGGGEQMLIGTIVIVLAVEYAAPKENAVYLVRYPERMSYLGVRLAVVISTCIGITVCKFIVAYCFLAIQFNSQLLLSTESIRRFSSGLLLFSIYAVRCGLVYMIVRDLLGKKNLAMGITVVIYFLELYIWADNLLGLPVASMWMPFRDLSASFDFVIGKVSGVGLSLVAVRQIGMTLLCLLIWGKVWKDKDVINLEK